LTSASEGEDYTASLAPSRALFGRFLEHCPVPQGNPAQDDGTSK
jgi:hypothetical protein